MRAPSLLKLYSLEGAYGILRIMDEFVGIDRDQIVILQFYFIDEENVFHRPVQFPTILCPEAFDCCDQTVPVDF